MIRVAFTLIGGSHWTGGHNYLINLLSILAEYQSTRITPILFVGEVSEEVIASLAVVNVEIVVTSHLNASRRIASLAQSLTWGRDEAMLNLFKQHRIDLLFENAQFFGWRLGVPVIAWIPDFQHRALPNLFSRIGWWKRDVGFRAQVVGGRTIMLSSEDARHDCEHYYPATRGRTHTVHFSVPPGLAVSQQESRNIAASYGLPEKFVFLPNQFWRHKNHFLVLDALSILKSRGATVIIAASGKQSDPRDPRYFPSFLAELERRGLQHEFRLLGLIPYIHIRPLMRASIAMLNPSLFEGWSTSVEEAQALGTPMLLSNLNVHKEQMGDRATYFDRTSAGSLAEALLGLTAVDEKQRESLVQLARHDAEQRVLRFSEDFVNLVEHCCKRFRE